MGEPGGLLGPPGASWCLVVLPGGLLGASWRLPGAPGGFLGPPGGLLGPPGPSRGPTGAMAVIFCVIFSIFLVVSAFWVPRITLKHEKTLPSQGSGSHFYVFSRGFCCLGAQNHPKTREITMFSGIRGRFVCVSSWFSLSGYPKSPQNT